MFDENHEMITSHTTNLVPFWHISNGENVELKEKTGCLADVAQTVLKTM
jgi:bisphosphoglycerate-independent phosphoglycerate mutase (AlkP superfamily)